MKSSASEPGLISVYGASEPDLKIIQNFLDICHNVISAVSVLA